jgi:multidrug resistance efflux pump
VETSQLWEIDGLYKLEKTWQILTQQSFDITSQASWEVSQLFVREWKKVVTWQVLARMNDSFDRYFLDLERSEIDYQKQLINKQTQILQLDKNIEDILRDLRDAERLYNNAIITAWENKKLAEIEFQNTRLSSDDSQARLALEKAKIDYDNILAVNQQKINWFKRDAQDQLNRLTTNVIDFIDFGDRLYEITDIYKNQWQDISVFFWVQDTVQKQQTESLLRNLITYQGILSQIDTSSMTQENLLDFFTSYSEWYNLAQKFLSSLEVTMRNSTPSLGALSQNEIDIYTSKINSFQSSNQSTQSSYNSSFSSAQSLLETYRESEQAALKNLEIIQNNSMNSEENSQITYNKKTVEINDILAASEKNLDRLQATYDNAIESEIINIKSLDNAIAVASNNVTRAQREFEKLTILSPISGIIESINIDVGQTVNSGNILMSIVWDDTLQVELALIDSEISDMNIGDAVEVLYSGTTYAATIFSISSLANNSLNYRVIIVLNDTIDFIGGNARVFFNMQTDTTSIPFNIVNVSWKNIGTIPTYTNWKLEEITIELWNIIGTNIEILTELPTDTEIILSDLTNFNPQSQTLITQ